MGQSLNIAVVGCGIGGLASACLLRDLGHQVTVFDQFKDPSPVGSGLVIQPVGQAVLAQIGVLAAARSHGVEITRMQGRNAASERMALWANYRDGKPGLSMHRGTLFQVLMTAATARQVEIVPDSFVLHADQDGGLPYLSIEGGRQAGPFDLVIDAGGAGSPLSPLVGRPLKYGALWGVVDLPEGETDLGGVLRQRYIGARKMAGVLPIGTVPGDPKPKAALFWSLRSRDYADWAEADIEDWRAEVTELWPEFGMLSEGIRTHADLTYTNYCHGSLFKLWTGRVFHLGDAAHQASPQLGQGANMALLDAAALAQALEPGLAGAARRYTAARFAHVRIYQLLSRVFTPLYQSDGAILPRFRDDVLTPLARMRLPGKAISRVVSGDLVPPFGLRGPKAGAVEASPALHEPGE